MKNYKLIPFIFLMVFLSCENKKSKINFPLDTSEFKQAKITKAIHSNYSLIPKKIKLNKYIFGSEGLDIRDTTIPIKRPIERILGKLTTKELKRENEWKFSGFETVEFYKGKIRKAISKKLTVKPKKIFVKTPNSYPFVLSETNDEATYNFKILSSEENLPGTGVSDMLKDSKGRIWVGVDNGLALIDGDQIKTYSSFQGLNKNNVSCLLEDKKGNIWIGSSGGGLIKYNGKYFLKYSIEEGLNDNFVNCIYEDKKGNIWFGTKDLGIIKYDGINFFSFNTDGGLSSNFVNGINEDKKGKLWISTSGGGISIYNGVNFQHIGVNEGLKSNFIEFVFEVKNGNIWLGNQNGGLQVIKGNEISNFKDPNHFLPDHISSIIETKNENLWFGSKEKGAFLFDGKTVTQFSSTEGLKVPFVRCFLEDGKNIWIGTWGGGLHLYKEKIIENYSTKEGLTNPYCYALLEDHIGNLWIGTNGGGIDVFDGKSIKNIGLKQGLSHQAVYCFLKDNEGKIWIGTQGGGINVFNGEKIKIYDMESGMSFTDIKKMSKDKFGNIWIATRGGGLNMFDGKSFRHFTKNEGLSSNYIITVFIDSRNRVWLGTEDNGIDLIEGNKVTHYSVKEGLTNNSVMTIMEDKHKNIWIGTFGGGLDIFDGKKFQNYSTEQGLSDNTVSIIEMDKNGNVWAGTYKGLTKFTPKKDRTYNLEVFGTNDGFRYMDFNGAMLLTKSNKISPIGTIWSCIGLTVSSFAPQKGNNIVPKMSITQLDINQTNIDWRRNKDLIPINKKNQIDTFHLPNSSDYFLSNSNHLDTNWLTNEGAEWNGTNTSFPSFLPLNLKLPAHLNNLTFHYSGMKLEEQKEVNYCYYLEGYDKKWSKITNESKAEYKNLFPGTYSFKVRSRGRNLIWSKEARFSFTILPPWYQTWWANLLFLIFFVYFISLIIKWRTRLLKKRQKELEQTVEERTAEVQEEKKLVEEKNREITDSITYAKRIQSAILPQPKLVKEFLKDSFILYKPKDIVAGDFYWLEVVGDTVLFAAADCTGHGVPGAMVSVVCNNGLNRAVREHKLIEPDQILNKTREIVIAEFEKSDEDVKDGMDISLCALDTKTNQLKWAGANNPLWILRNNAIIEHKADKQPIGKYSNEKPFSLLEVQLQKNDIIYIFTDGYQDQFGGPKEKKFRVAQMRQLYLSLTSKTMEEQRKIINESFENWKGELEQVDDVCLIGIRI